MNRTNRTNLWSLYRLSGVLLAISGLVMQASVAWAQSLEVAGLEKTRGEVAKRVERLIRETAQRDPELAQEIERQKELVMHEMKHGRLNDTHLIHEIENFRTVQRELTHRVAQVEVEYRIAEVAGDNPALTQQLRAAFETWRNGNGKETFEWFERGEGIHHLSPEGLERVQRETERFVAEHPDKAGYAREFVHQEFERARPQAREHGAMSAADHAHQTLERPRTEGRTPEGMAKMRDNKTQELRGPRNPGEVERAREVPIREADRGREASSREVERVHEAPTREIERVREVPAREVERVRETPTAERSAERAADHAHDRNDQRLDQQQKTPRKR